MRFEIEADTFRAAFALAGRDDIRPGLWGVSVGAWRGDDLRTAGPRITGTNGHALVTLPIVGPEECEAHTIPRDVCVDVLRLAGRGKKAKRIFVDVDGPARSAEITVGRTRITTMLAVAPDWRSLFSAKSRSPAPVLAGSAIVNPELIAPFVLAARLRSDGTLGNVSRGARITIHGQHDPVLIEFADQRYAGIVMPMRSF